MKAKTLLLVTVMFSWGGFASFLNAQYYAPANDARYYVPANDVTSPPAASASTPALPADARELVKQYEAEKAEIQKAAQKKVRERRLLLTAALKQLQDRYTRGAKLDEAVAIRDCARTLKESDMRPLPDPGMLYAYNNSVGREFYFRVTGNNQRTVWGTDIYTTDSGLASAAVHAGVLKLGQTGVVKVTILPGQFSYQASARNGVASSSWNNFPTSFKVEAVDDEDQEAGDDEDRQPVEKASGKPARTAAVPQADKTSVRQVEELRQEVSRLQRELREVSAQMKQFREEPRKVKKPIE
jgi:hypothetical protein